MQKRETSRKEGNSQKAKGQGEDEHLSKRQLKKKKKEEEKRKLKSRLPRRIRRKLEAKQHEEKISKETGQNMEKFQKMAARKFKVQARTNPKVGKLWVVLLVQILFIILTPLQYSSEPHLY